MQYLVLGLESDNDGNDDDGCPIEHHRGAIDHHHRCAPYDASPQKRHNDDDHARCHHNDFATASSSIDHISPAPTVDDHTAASDIDDAPGTGGQQTARGDDYISREPVVARSGVRP